MEINVKSNQLNYIINNPNNIFNFILNNFYIDIIIKKTININIKTEI